MELRQMNVFKLYTTPKQLREAAKQMEASWSRKRLGDSTCVQIVYSGDNLSILELHVDQQLITKESA